MEPKTIHANPIEAAKATRSVAALFDSLESSRRTVMERAMTDPDCAHIALGDANLSKVSGLYEKFVAAPQEFSRGSALEVLKNYPGLRGGGGAYAEAEQDKKSGKNDPAEYERKRSELNSLAKEYGETLAKLRELVKKDTDCAEAVARRPQWLAYRTAEGDTMAHEVVRNSDKSFVRRFVRHELRRDRGESVLTLADDYGWTPLHWAAMNYEVARDLTELPAERLGVLSGVADDAKRSVGDMIKGSLAREASRLRELDERRAAEAYAGKTMKEKVLAEARRA
jgi:hypothetical protein